jgi:hypothetical protein
MEPQQQARFRHSALFDINAGPNICMKLSELISIAGSEEKSEEFLRAKGILKTFKLCLFVVTNQ